MESKMETTLKQHTHEVRLALIPVLDSKLSKKARLSQLELLRASVKALEQEGYKAANYGELVHVYRNDLTEKEIWRHNGMVGLTASSIEEWQVCIYNRLWEATQAAVKQRRARLAKYYVSGLLQLKKLWQVEDFVRVVGADGKVKEVRFICQRL